MKNNLVIILLITGLFIKAQQQELIENTWYLEKLMIEGNELLAPHNEEVEDVVFEYVEGQYIFHTNVCASIFIDIDFANSNSFWAQSWEENDQYCTESSNSNFEHIYFNDFWVMGIFEGRDFNYEITEENEELKLVISAHPDLTAHYTTRFMSTSEMIATDFQLIFQNDNLIIQSNSTKAQSISIYDLSGKQLLNANVLNEKLNTKALPKGIYLIQLTDEKGNVFSEKVRKPY